MNKSLLSVEVVPAVDWGIIYFLDVSFPCTMQQLLISYEASVQILVLPFYKWQEKFDKRFPFASVL